MPKSALHLMSDNRRLLRLYNSGEVFCSIDTETTGLKPDCERIIEIGAVKFDKTGVLQNFSQLVNPDREIPPFITELTHIDAGMLKDKPSFTEISRDFLKFTENTVLIAHNAQFDIRFLNKELERSGIEPLKNHAIDTLRLSRWAYPENGHWTLQFLAEQFHINVEAAHRARDDARVCMELFIQCLKDTKDRQKQ